jgi:PAS domain-containing protein
MEDMRRIDLPEIAFDGLWFPENGKRGIMRVTPPYDVAYADEAFWRIFDIEPAEGRRWKCYDLLQNERCFTSRCPMRAIVGGKSREIAGYEVRRRNGDRRSVLIVYRPEFDRTGRFTGMRMEAADITEKLYKNSDVRHPFRLNVSQILAAEPKHA